MAADELESLTRRVADALVRFRTAGIQVDVVAGRPKPLIALTFGTELDVRALELGCLMLGLVTKANRWRAVRFDRLPTVLASGVDVEPSDAPIYVGDIGKALEYGGAIKWGAREPTVLLGFGTDGLDRTFREVRSDIDQAALDRLKETFPNVTLSADGRMLLLSRIADRPVAYEFDYGYWIPGDPLEALRIVFVLGVEDREIGRATRDATSACTVVAWR